MIRAAWAHYSIYNDYKHVNYNPDDYWQWGPQSTRIYSQAALSRSASAYERNVGEGFCAYGITHSAGIRWNPASDSRNSSYSESTVDIGWHVNGSHYIDWGTPQPNSEYDECDDIILGGAYWKTYVVGIDKEYP